MDIERRFQTGELEVREAVDQKPGHVGGYAIVFETMSEVLGSGVGRGFREKIAPFALDEVNMTRTVALYNHDSSMVLGNARSGTLQLAPDTIGLKFSVDLPDTTYAADLYKMLMRNDITGASFGFTVANGGESWDVGPDDIPVRTITKIESIPEISVGVVFPAYPASSSVVERCRQFTDKRAKCHQAERDARARRLQLIEIGV